MATLITKNSSTASAVPAAGDLVKGELAVNVTDKKVYTKDNSAAVVKLVGSLGNQEANAVAITGGTINGTTIGATTPSTGAFTTASASSGFTGNLTGNVTGNVSGTAANVTGVVAIANGGTGLSALGTGVQSALGQAVTGSGSFVLSTSPSLTTPNLGTPSAAVLTNATGLPLTTGVTGTLGVANGGTGITAFGTGVATALGQNVTGSGGIVLATSPSLTTPNLGTPSAATLTNATGLPISTGVSGLGTGVATALGVAVGSAGAFVVNGGALGTPSSGTLTNATGLPVSTGVSGLGTGVATALAVNTGSAGAFVVNGGALGTPSSGTVTNLTGTASININGTVGATTPTTGAFTTTTISTSETLSYGTANGVAYLNGSKVLTTGSALSFNGTRFTTYVTSDTNTNIARFGVVNTAITDDAFLDISADAANNLITLNSTGNNAGSFAFQTGGSEQMRLTSTGLGIGTSSPAAPLSFAASTGQKIRFFNSVTGYGIGVESSEFRFVTDSSASFTWRNGSYSGGTTYMTLDASGNLGLGVTPSAWASGWSAFQISSSTSSLSAKANNGVYLTYNGYNNNTNWLYSVTGQPSGAYAIVNPAGNIEHRWFNAASGTAGNTISFTQAMTLDASGQLMVGGTNPDGQFTVDNATTPYMSIRRAGSTVLYFGSANTLVSGGSTADGAIRAQSNLVFATGGNTERARITSGGYFKTSNSGSYNSSTGAFHEFRGDATTKVLLVEATNASFADDLAVLQAARNTTNNSFYALSYYNSGAAAYKFRVADSGNVTNTNNSYGAISDIKLKENITDATPKLASLNQLRVVNYNFKGSDLKQIGLVAQEVEQVFPGLVETSADRDAEGNDLGTTTKSVKYSVLVPMLLKAVQELTAINDDLRARVAQLEAK